MKKLFSIAAILCFLTFLPLGFAADDHVDQPGIPNHTITQDTADEGSIPNLMEETEDKTLNPVERHIVTTDIIQSNASTAIPVQVGQ